MGEAYMIPALVRGQLHDARARCKELRDALVIAQEDICNNLCSHYPPDDAHSRACVDAKEAIENV